jgi:hypothetical protein
MQLEKIELLSTGRSMPGAPHAAEVASVVRGDGRLTE